MSGPGLLAIPHPDNGKRCTCGSPIYLTPNGWTDRAGRGSHTPPARRRQPARAGEPNRTLT